MTAAAVEAELVDGSLHLRWPRLAATGAVRARLLDSAGIEHVSEAWHRLGEGFWATCGPVRVELAVEASGPLAHLRLAAEASRPVQVRELGLTCAPELAGGEPLPWVVYSGYQSWDPSGIGRVAPPAATRSWWTVGLGSQGGSGVAAAATAAERATTRFDRSESSLVVTAEEPAGLDEFPVLWSAATGARWTADPWVFSAGTDVQAELARVASAARRRPSREVPRGWLSWYHYGPWITAEEVLANSHELHDGCLAGLGYSTLQVDDGWQEQYGDWSPNEKFPGGLAAIAAEIAGRGQQLGVWTAPFLVAASSRLAATAPDDWFVRSPGADGRAVDPVHQVFGPMNVLDAGNPAVREHLTATFRSLRAEGVTYFKIDFLYAGAYAGTAALRAGVEAIRNGIGEDAYLLGCGAPLLPMVGICDGCRIGRDTATPVFDFELGGPKPTLIDDEVAEVARNQAARHFLAAWFQLDADVALVGGNLSLGQAQCSVAYCALSGGPFFASDALPGLDPARLGLLRSPDVLSLVGGPSAVPDWDPTDRDRAASTWRRPDAIGVFNWEAADRVIAVSLPGPGRVFDLWSGDELGQTDGSFAVPVPALGARLLRHRPD